MSLADEIDCELFRLAGKAESGGKRYEQLANAIWAARSESYLLMTDSEKKACKA